MRKTLQIPRAARLLLAAVALSVAAPAPTQAAEAPLRAISLDASGVPQQIAPSQISADGDQTLRGAVSTAQINTVSTGTRELLPLGNETYRYGFEASPDLRRIAFQSATALSPQDTNSNNDLYVYDRPTGTYTFVTAAPGGGSLLADDGTGQKLAEHLHISGDGNVVQFSIMSSVVPATTPQTYKYENYRFEIPTGTLTKVVTSLPFRTRAIDDAGRIQITKAGIFGTSRKLPTPANMTNAVIAPDGSAIAFWKGPSSTAGYGNQFTIVDLNTGLYRVRTIPAWLVAEGYDVWGIADGGGTILLGALLERSPGVEPYILGKFNTVTGELLQWGADIRVSRSSTVRAVSPGWDFAATDTHIAQLGSRPLPGVDPGPGTPLPVNAAAYAVVGDSYCVNNFFYKTYTKPYVRLASGPSGGDLRRPASATAVVTMGTQRWAYSLTPGTKKDLAVGTRGGWSIRVQVTLEDGATGEFTQAFPTHGAPVCPPFEF